MSMEVIYLTYGNKKAHASHCFFGSPRRQLITSSYEFSYDWSVHGTHSSFVEIVVINRLRTCVRRLHF